MMNQNENHHARSLSQPGVKALDKVMKQILDLAQSSLPENQFLAFRKMSMDFFADARRSLFGADRCGEGKTMVREGANMSE